MLHQLATGVQSYFSREANTTSPNAPFGVVTIHAGGWEGNPANGGQMHWAQTLNYGVLPNPLLPTGFVAAAHDLGDPWNTQECLAQPCCSSVQPPNVSAGKNE
jgi:hypothetical protein